MAEWLCGADRHRCVCVSASHGSVSASASSDGELLQYYSDRWRSFARSVKIARGTLKHHKQDKKQFASHQGRLTSPAGTGEWQGRGDKEGALLILFKATPSAMVVVFTLAFVPLR